jgi:hypothetical protein
MKSAFKKAVLLPSLLWFSFYLASFLFGYTAYPIVLEASSTGTINLLLAIFFGLWIGIESFGSYKLSRAIGYAFLVSFVMGAVQVLVAFVLINTSQAFLTLATYIYNVGLISAPIINVQVSIWLGIIFAGVLGSAVGYSLISKIKTK